STQDSERQEHELGDLLFALTSLARHLNLDAETVLRKAGKRFNDRFRYIETQLRQNNEDIHHTSPARLEKLWQDAKQRLGEHANERAKFPALSLPYYQEKAGCPCRDCEH